MNETKEKYLNSRLNQLWEYEIRKRNKGLNRLFGIPVWIRYFDGSFHKRRARINPDGTLRSKAIYWPITLRPDKTVSGLSIYVETWDFRD